MQTAHTVQTSGFMLGTVTVQHKYQPWVFSDMIRHQLSFLRIVMIIGWTLGVWNLQPNFWFLWFPRRLESRLMDLHQINTSMYPCSHILSSTQIPTYWSGASKTTQCILIGAFLLSSSSKTIRTRRAWPFHKIMYQYFLIIRIMIGYISS